MILFNRFLNESLYWLLCDEHIQGLDPSVKEYRKKEAVRVVRRIEKTNNIEEESDAELAELLNSPEQPIPIIRRQISKVGEAARTGPACFRLVATPKLRYITLAVVSLWFANSLAYYGLQWSAQLNEGTDFYLSYFLLAIVEVPSTILVLFILPRFVFFIQHKKPSFYL